MIGWLGILLLGLVLAPASTEAARTVERTVSATVDGEVEIELIAGSVTVIGWDRKQVEVTGTIGDDVEELEIDTDDDRVEISVELPDRDDGYRHHGNLDLEATLTVRVPAGSRVYVEGVNVPIEVSGVTGALELGTVNGNITVTGSPEAVEAEAVNGTILIDADVSQVEVEAVAGQIVLIGVSGEVDAECVSGDIEIREAEITDGNFSNVSGNVEFQGTVAGRGSLEFESHSGDIVLVLPGDISAEFDVSTFSGSIQNGFGPKARETGKYTPGMELSFSAGSGRASIYASTFSGNVELVKK